MNLGKLTGKLSSGAATLAGFREDKRNIAKPGTFFSKWAICGTGQLLSDYKAKSKSYG